VKEVIGFDTEDHIIDAIARGEGAGGGLMLHLDRPPLANHAAITMDVVMNWRTGKQVAGTE
jgi:hypothetical protein